MKAQLELMKKQLELVKIFNAASYKSIIKMNLNLMVFIQEIVYLKKLWENCKKC